MKFDEIRFIKPFEDGDRKVDPGQIKNYAKKSAKFLVDNGFAEYTNNSDNNKNKKRRNLKQKVKQTLKEEAENYTIRQSGIIQGSELLKDEFFEDDNFIAAKFVESVLESYPYGTFVTPVNDQGGDVIWVYNDEKGIFENLGIPWIEEKLKNIIGNQTKTTYFNQVIKHLQVETYREPREFQPDPEIIVVENGTLNIFEKELMNNSQIYNAKIKIPVKYDPRADCIKIKEFIKEIAPNSVKFLQEWIGYHLLQDYRFQRVVVLVGDGDNGKSTLLNLLIKFLSPENVSNQSLYRLSTNRFACAELKGKLANIAADIGPDELRHTGIIKMLTGEDWLTVERKNRDPEQMRNCAKLTFSCNQLPRTPDETLAFFKRFIVIVFEKIIPPEEQDPKLLEKLTTPEELSGLLNWALEGLHRTLERGKLDEPGDLMERKELYMAMSDPVTGFCNENIIEISDKFEIKQDIIKAFHSYCKQKGFVPLSDRKFVELFKKTVWVKEGQYTLYNEEYPEGKRYRVWKGIELSEKFNKTEYSQNKNDYAQHAQDTQGSQTQLKTDENSSELVNPVQPVQPVQEDNLIKKIKETSIEILKNNQNKMEVNSFFYEIVELGYNQYKVNQVLKNLDNLFVFQGPNLFLKEEEKND